MHYKCVHLLGCICCGGNNGSAAGNVGKKAEKCIWLLRNWNKQGDHKRVVKGRLEGKALKMKHCWQDSLGGLLAWSVGESECKCTAWQKFGTNQSKNPPNSSCSIIGRPSPKYELEIIAVQRKNATNSTILLCSAIQNPVQISEEYSRLSCSAVSFILNCAVKRFNSAVLI